ncbi:MAG: alpha/beta hydrolase [Defluviitaleaceae bacterium]|nr:alpha/beta hydrolase [Defluviitaleaceae bacterium]
MTYTVNGLDIFYEDIGAGKPVLCLHGFTEDHRSMKGCLEPIFAEQAGYRRIYVDMPGMGKTHGADWIKNADIMLDVLKKFIKGVVGDEVFLLIGTSYGGYMSLGLAQDDQANIDGIFLFGPCVVSDHDKRKLPDVEDDELFVEDGLEDEFEHDDDFDDFINTAVNATKWVWERYQAEILPAYKIADKAFTGKYRKNGYALSSEGEFGNLEFAKPFTVMVGKQDESVGYEDAWDLLKHLPKLTYVCLDGAGHLMQLEKPEVFNFHIKSWLGQIK